MVFSSIANDVSPPLRSLGATETPLASDVGMTGGGSLLGPIENFEGIANEENHEGSSSHPPDANGAAGPLHYVQWVNHSLAVYDKRGVRVLGPMPGNSVWSGFGGLCETENRGDPIVRYDQLANRWVLTQFAAEGTTKDPPHRQCFAVSTGPDPLGAYYRYEFDIPGGFNDYVKLAVWPDAYYMTDERYKEGTGHIGSGAFAFDRAAMLAGHPATFVYFQLGLPLFGLLPSDLDGPTPAPGGTPGVFVKVYDDGCDAPFGAPIDQIELWSFSVNFAVPNASTFLPSKVLPTDSFDSKLCSTYPGVEQPGEDQLLVLHRGRMLFRASVRNFASYQSLVALHEDVGPGQRVGLRWYEIRDPARPTAEIREHGTYFGPPGDADSRWAGSVAQDRAGDIALGFSVVGANLPPSIGYAGRSAADPPGTLTSGDGRLATGGGVQMSLDRWGDYSSLTVDPVDDCTFWYTQEYYPESADFDWHTRIGSFRFEGCGALPTISPGSEEGDTLTASPGNWLPLTNASFTYQWRRCTAPGESCTDIVGATGQTYTMGTADVDGTLRVLVRASTARAEASALSKPTRLITPTPAVGPLGLTTSIAVAPASVTPGGQTTYTVKVGNATLTGSATDVVLRVQLPPGAQMTSSASERGPGCSGTREVVCPLEFIPGGRIATVSITARLTTRGAQTAIATVTAQQAPIDPSATEASVTVNVQGAPRLALRGPVRTTRTVRATTVSAIVSVDEPSKLTVRCLGATGKVLLLLKGSVVGKRVLLRPSAAIIAPRPSGNVRLSVKVAPRTTRGTVVVRALDAEGKTARLALPFRVLTP
jgi:hypothetical protein